jgi:hypothetical protein
MTSNQTSQTEREPERETEKSEVPPFKTHVPTLFASSAATVTAAVASSYLGKTGTLVGMAGGSLLSGSAAIVYERWIRRGTLVIQKKPWAEHVKWAERVKTGVREAGVPWRALAGGVGVTLVASVGVVTAVEAVTSKPLSSTVWHKPGSGLSVDPVSDYVPHSQPVVVPSELPTQVATPTFTASPSASPTALPTATPTASASSSPSVTIFPPTASTSTPPSPGPTSLAPAPTESAPMATMPPFRTSASQHRRQ